IEKYVTAIQLAPFHARIAGQVLDLAAFALHFMGATPSATCHRLSSRFNKGTIVRGVALRFKSQW
ncbi:MAG: hypothetical protein QMB52_13770, partial [Propionivibrio sp.]